MADLSAEIQIQSCKWDFHAGEHRKRPPVFPSLEHLEQRQLFGAEPNPEFWLISTPSTTIWAIRRWNHIPQVRWENRSAWWLPDVPVGLCAVSGYIIHTNTLEKSGWLDRCLQSFDCTIRCLPCTSPTVEIYVLWFTLIPPVTALNNLLLWLLTCRNNKGKQWWGSSVSICFHLKARRVESVAFSDLHAAPWSLLSAFTH